MQASAIVVAAGKGERLKSKIPKPLIKLAHKPLVIYSLGVFSRHPGIKEIIVVANSLNAPAISAAIKKYRIKKIKAVVLGDKRRQDSVYNGLKAVSPQSGMVLVHDAARPFIDKAIVSACLREALSSPAAIAAVPVRATIKQVTRSPGHQVTSTKIVKKTIDRENLWEIQTPQVFKKGLLLEAFKKYGRTDVTDEAMLIEKAGKKVAIAPGSYLNIKITVPEDLALAEAIIKAKKWNRVRV